MRIDALLTTGEPTFSFEFFPPRDDAAVSGLLSTVDHLRRLDPAFVSVTYGAGGSARERTLDLVARIREELSVEPMAHFTCVGATVPELHAVLGRLAAAGVENVLALRGDPPVGTDGFSAVPGGLAHAAELVALLRTGYDFCIGCACHPERHVEDGDDDAEVRNLVRKSEAGADFFITQLFFDNRVYFDFVARARAAGVTAPIIPGIMPVTNVAQLERFSGRIGASIPRALLDGLQERQDDPDAVLQLGVAWSTLQCAELLAAGAPGVHFYTLNRSAATRAILSALRARRPWLH